MCGRHFGNFLIPALASVLVADSTNKIKQGHRLLLALFKQ